MGDMDATIWWRLLCDDMQRCATQCGVLLPYTIACTSQPSVLATISPIPHGLSALDLHYKPIQPPFQPNFHSTNLRSLPPNPPRLYPYSCCSSSRLSCVHIGGGGMVISIKLSGKSWLSVKGSPFHSKEAWLLPFPSPSKGEEEKTSGAICGLKEGLTGNTC